MMEFTAGQLERMRQAQRDGHRFDVLFGSEFRGFSTLTGVPLTNDDHRNGAIVPALIAVERMRLRTGRIKISEPLDTVAALS